MSLSRLPLSACLTAAAVSWSFSSGNFFGAPIFIRRVRAFLKVVCQVRRSGDGSPRVGSSGEASAGDLGTEPPEA